MSSLTQILVGCNDKVVCIRVRGRGTFENSVGVKNFAKEMIQRGHREFVVDLTECPMMDSTFMGTLTGMALQLRTMGQGNVHVTGCNTRNLELLEGLGLDHILRVATNSDTSCTEQGGSHEHSELPPDAESEDRVETQRTMLAAHQALVDADPENFSRFKDVLDYLQQDLGVQGRAE